MYTNKEILAQAKSDSRMVYVGQSYGYDSYKLQDWNEDKNAWFESCSQYPYSSAKHVLKHHYIDRVLEIIYPDDLYQQTCYNNRVDHYNDWRQYAREIINNARVNQQGIFARTEGEE